MVLLTSIILLVFMTVLAIVVFKSYGVLQLLSGDVREKQRSFESAQAALQYGEWFLNTGNVATGVTCTASGGYPAFSTAGGFGVCTDALPSPTVVPWVNSSSASLGSAVLLNGMQISTSGKAGYFYAQPQVYIQYLGLSKDGKMNPTYQVTAFGYGGTANAVSVVQSTYVLVNQNHDFSSP